MEPPGYLDCVRNGAIEVVEGSIDSLQGREAHLIDKHGKNQTLKADNVILATGYSLVSKIHERCNCIYRLTIIGFTLLSP